MSYVVSASDRSRPVSFRRGSMIAALEQGLALLGFGMNDVRIIGPGGHSLTPAEFTRAMLDGPAPNLPDASGVAIGDR